MTKISQENLRSILAAIHNFSLSSDFGIHHLEKQGQPMWCREAEQNKNQIRRKRRRKKTNNKDREKKNEHSHTSY